VLIFEQSIALGRCIRHAKLWQKEAEMGFQINRLGRNDVAQMQALNGLFAEVFEDPESYASAPPSASYLQQLLSNDLNFALVALKGSNIIGGLFAYQLQKFEQARSEIYIYDLAVSAQHRRRGVATALIMALRDLAQQRDCWVIYVQADYVDAPAVALYTKLGLREDVLHFDITVPAKP
jgi:aminoglycoside 3-N-acetyltransferase I